MHNGFQIRLRSDIPLAQVEPNGKLPDREEQGSQERPDPRHPGHLHIRQDFEDQRKQARDDGQRQ